MILVITNKSDIHCNPVLKHFVNSGDHYFRLNTDALLVDYEITFSVKDNIPNLEIFNKINKKSIESSEIKSVWERRPTSPEVFGINNSKIKGVLEDEAAEFARWLRFLLASTRNLGSSIWDRPNESKLRQMTIASKIISDKSLSISLPATLITNKQSEVMEFATLFSDVVVKPIGSDSIELDDEYEMPFVSRKLSSKKLKGISKDDIALCPTFLQNYIDKEYELRITAVGTKFFCCKIDSQTLPEGKGKEDWREGYDYGLPQTWIAMPDELVEFCSSYLESIQSKFGCFDFIRDRHGIFYFLECNPNGQWMWMEEDIGIPISKAIADFLSSRAN